jgi:mono/diheme cytochrome c family protein
MGIILFFMLIDPKIEYRQHCIGCHEPAAILFKNPKTKDLRKTIYDMYRRDSPEIPSKAQLDSMLKYAKSLKKN